MESNTTLSRRRGFLAGTGMGALLASSAVHADSQLPRDGDSECVNVKELGAEGDGVTDDWEAFSRAIDQGRQQRRSVRIPEGRYRLTRPLSVHTQGLIGNPWGSWVADIPSLPTLLPESTMGPALTTEAGGPIAGIEIRYPNDDPSKPVERPAAIRLGETGAVIRCVKISHPWIGIDTRPVHTNPGRSVVENVFISGAHRLGVHFSGAADVCLFRNIEVWTPPPTSDTFLSEGVGFHFQRGDGIRITDCFAFGANRGFLFTEDASDGPLGGAFTGYLSNCLSDFCNTGIELRGDHRVTITGGSHWSHHSCVRLEEGRSSLLASAVEMSSNANASLYVGSAKDVLMQGCRFERPHTQFSGPAIQIAGGGHVSLTGNVIRALEGPAILIGPDRGPLLLQGNMVEGDIRETGASTSPKQIEGNLTS